MILVNPKLNKIFTFSLRLFPIMPDTVSKSVSKPFINGFQLDVDTGKAVIIYPSPPDLSQLFQPFLEAVRFGFLGDLLELTFERLPTVLFHHQLVFSFVPFLICRNKCMSQQLEVRGSSDATALRAPTSHSRARASLLIGSLSLSLK